MARALNGGHVSRALEFYNKEGKYMIVGGTKPWGVIDNPPDPSDTDFKLEDVIGLKRFNSIDLVVPDDEYGTIKYRNRKWRKVIPEITTTLIDAGAPLYATDLYLSSTSTLKIGNRVRISDIYEGKIVDIKDNRITLDEAAPVELAGGLEVKSGAIIEGAKYVYITCYLEYDSFPLQTYRQIGICAGVLPDKKDTLLSAAYSTSKKNEYESLGILEVLDNRYPITRNKDMREMISMIIEF